jgi:asparagine synthase (glutamine-hydrolysing)
MQDTLRGSALLGLPFFEPKAVIGLLDALPGLDAETLTAIDAPLMILTTACVMNDRFGMSA